MKIFTNCIKYLPAYLNGSLNTQITAAYLSVIFKLSKACSRYKILEYDTSKYVIYIYSVIFMTLDLLYVSHKLNRFTIQKQYKMCIT